MASTNDGMYTRRSSPVTSNFIHAIELSFVSTTCCSAESAETFLSLSLRPWLKHNLFHAVSSIVISLSLSLSQHCRVQTNCRCCGETVEKVQNRLAWLRLRDYGCSEHIAILGSLQAEVGINTSTRQRRSLHGTHCFSQIPIAPSLQPSCTGHCGADFAVNTFLVSLLQGLSPCQGAKSCDCLAWLYDASSETSCRVGRPSHPRLVDWL